MIPIARCTTPEGGSRFWLFGLLANCAARVCEQSSRQSASICVSGRLQATPNGDVCMEWIEYPPGSLRFEVEGAVGLPDCRVESAILLPGMCKKHESSTHKAPIARRCANSLTKIPGTCGSQRSRSSWDCPHRCHLELGFREYQENS